MTEPLEPYRPAESHDDEWGYDQEEEQHPRVLWGRVAVLTGMLLVAFFIGRTTKSSGVPESELTKAETQIADLQKENEDLKSELAAAQTEQAAAPIDPASDPTTSDDGETSSTQEAGMNYTVRSGDTLTTIAEEFYGDPSLDDFLAEYNEIDDPSSLAVGQTIFLPDDTTP